jgi:uncharacterized protein (DUF433 family)
MADKPVSLDTLIDRAPGVHGGRPLIAGTGVTVQRIAGWYKLGYNAEEIAREISHLSIGQVWAALAYYHANRDEIEGYLKEEAEDYERLSAEYAAKRAKVA